MLLKKISLTSFCLAGLFTVMTLACPPISVGDITLTGHRWIRPSKGPNTAAYMTMTNRGSEPDKLNQVECDFAETVELHNNIEEAGIMKMRPVDTIEIGKEPVELKPGGLHIMLMGLKDSFQGKEVIPLTLVFDKAGRVTVNFSVKEPKKP